jgi:hypothetical protein
MEMRYQNRIQRQQDDSATQDFEPKPSLKKEHANHLTAVKQRTREPPDTRLESTTARWYL